MQRLTIVKAWYQNDLGRFGRRDERLARALQSDPRVARVIHLEPPLARRGEPPLSQRATPALPERARPEGARDGGLVLFTPTFEAGSANPWRDVLEQTARFLAANGAWDDPALLWLSAPGAFGDQLLGALGGRFRWIVAEIEDDHRHWCARRSEEQLAVARRYERAVRSSDLLISNAQAMVDEFARLQPNALRVANAVDAAPFESSSAEPACLAGVARPRLAYVGNLRLRLRPDLLAATAAAFPQASIVLAGEDDGALRSALAEHGSFPNVRFVGRLAPVDVPPFLLHADVLLLPHVTGAITDAMDPQKLYEYLASGRPIVSTPIAGARDHAGLVTLADDSAGFVAAVGAALAEPRDDAACERRRTAVRGRTWEAAATRVLDAALAVAKPGERRRAEQALGYFQHDRPEVRALVPATARRVLDVGCGTGALGGALKFRSTRIEQVTGIELDERAASRARESLDRVIAGDAVAKLRELVDEGARFDVVLFADLLEHLPRPEEALAHARALLERGGVVVASLPNVRHWSVVRQLLEGDFRYEAAGILDRTHLRFFTRRSAQRFFVEHGFAVERIAGARWAEEGIPAAVADALASAGVDVGGLAEESREHQWLFVARAAVAADAASRDAQPPERGVAPARSERSPAVAASAPALSVVIPVCNAADYTRGCLDELRARGGGGLDVVVVDNGSTDATSAVLSAHPEVRVIRNAENRGFAGAVNQGLQAVSAPLVCVLNNDTLLTEGWRAPLVRLLEQQPSIALVGPCTSFAKGRQQIDLLKGAGAFESIEQLRALASSWCEKERGRVEDVSFLSGFCFAGRRDELRAIGGLADAYGRGTFEDDELCRRLRREGRRLVIARDSYVHHFGNRTFRALGVNLAQQQAENGQRFAARHHDDPAIAARDAAIQERWEEVLPLTLAALRRSPKDLDALWLAAMAAAKLGKPQEARRLIARYLVHCPFDAAAGAVERDVRGASREIASG